MLRLFKNLKFIKFIINLGEAIGRGIKKEIRKMEGRFGGKTTYIERREYIGMRLGLCSCSDTELIL